MTTFQPCLSDILRYSSWAPFQQTMSRRTLGGGRVLGSGRNLGPAAPQNIPKSPSPLPAHVISPSASTLSLQSGSGTSTPPSAESQDLISRISIDHGDLNLTAAAASDRLSCPICNEEMVTLLQLNRHLDDAHKEIQEERQDEIEDWFKKQMVKAKKFQPLAVLNQKLKGIDIFESNDEGASTPIRRGSDPNTIGQRTASPVPVPPPRPKSPVVDPDEVVRKDHWQRHGDMCSDPLCGRRLGAANGRVNCRHCGKLFCDEHTMYQMKLSRAAKHEPVRGFWCRVCETCYKSRDGYNDRTGLERNHMATFTNIRRQHVDKTYLEVSRLEKRLTRLTQLMANPPEEVQQVANKRWSLPLWGQTDPRKALEQSVVAWQDDATVSRCPYCQQEFTQYTFRRHHCRTCGKIVCGDPATGCSTLLGLNVATSMYQHPSVSIYADRSVANASIEKPEISIPVDVRLCKECNTTLFAKRDFADSLKAPHPLSRSYHNLVQFERGIRMLMPQFQSLLTKLQSPDHPPTSQDIANASKIRKRLMDAFTQYDIASRRVRDMPTDSPTQQKLQKAIYQQASQFLHLHMLPLKTLPKILKHATPNGDRVGSTLTDGNIPNNNRNGLHPRGALASIHYHNRSFDSTSQLSNTPTTSSQISAMEAEEKLLRERLIVLEEQKFMVSEMLAAANKRRKFDEMGALQGNVEDLSREIDGVQNQIAALDFEGLYAAQNGLGDGVMTPPQQQPRTATKQMGLPNG